MQKNNLTINYSKIDTKTPKDSTSKNSIGKKSTQKSIFGNKSWLSIAWILQQRKLNNNNKLKRLVIRIIK